MHARATRRLALVAGLLAVAPVPARAAGIRFLEEYQFENATSSYVRVSANRFFLVGYPMDPVDPLVVRRYKIFDLATRTIGVTEMPLVAFRAAHAAIFKKTEMPTLVHYDGRFSTFTMDERPQHQAVARYLCRYDHQTGTFQTPIRLGGMTKSDWTLFVQPDATDRHVYFGNAASASGDDVNKAGATSARLGRVRLDEWKIDRETTFKPFRGEATFRISGLAFSRDGRKAVFSDFGGTAAAAPATHLHVIDLESGAMRDATVPLALFGLTFDAAAENLLVSSRTGRSMARFDLAADRITATAPTAVRMHGLLLTPSGRSVYTFINETTATVRRTTDLKQTVSLPARSLFPGIERIFPEDTIMTTVNGRFLLTPIYDLNSFPLDTGFRLYEVPDDIDSVGPAAPVSAKVAADKLFNVALRYARDKGIRFTTYHTKGVGDPTESFAPAVIAPDGGVFLGGTRNIATADLTKPRTTPVIASVDAAGKGRWTREVPKAGFLDYEVASVAATSDGGCVARVVSMVDPGQGAIERFIKFDAAGKTVWERQFPGDGSGVNTPFVDLGVMGPDDVAHLTGRIYPGVGVELKWRADLHRDGTVVGERTGE